MGKPLPMGIGGDLGVDGGFVGSGDGLIDGDELFERTWRVVIATKASDEEKGVRIPGTGSALESTEHDIKFKITKSVKSEPNKCTLEIYNLNEEQRLAIDKLNPSTPGVHVRDTKKIKAAARKTAKKGIGVQIEAGYAGKNNLLWLGDMRTAESEFVSPNWVTKLTSGDGEKAWQNARVNVSYGAKTPVSTACRAMVKALGLGVGNMEEVLAEIHKTGKLYAQGTVWSGPVQQLLTDWCRAADMTWSIQDGTVQFLRRGKALANRALKVAAGAGMLGSPKLDIDGVLTVKTVLLPDVRPGRLIVLDARQHSGNYRIEQVIYDGESDGTNWGCTLKCITY